METVLVKIGGKAAENEERLQELCAELTRLAGQPSSPRRFLIVHGGGASVTALSRKLGIEPVFKDGVRQTSPEEMDVVDMVLSGLVNTQLVRRCRARGLDAVGLSGVDGGTFLGKPLDGGVGGTGRATSDAGNRTAEVASVDTRLLTLLLANGFLPVLSSASMSRNGVGLNINADSAAFALAAEMAVASLVFLSDVPGILANGRAIPEISAAEVKTLVASGVITGGMIPKVSASVEAIARGVMQVIIGQYEGQDSLARLLSGRQGTRIRK